MSDTVRTADAYVRVSRVAGREGENFIAPDVQLQKIDGWAKLHGVEIVQVWEELDQSGAKRDRPMFQEALERCERGETGGIVVARLDRFARSAVDALESIKRLNEAGARLVSVEDNFDGSTAMGRFAIGILTLLAELELERIKESWGTAVREAVGRGVHISARVPTGYRRDEASRLHPVEPHASAVREAFRRRALGASYTELARFLEEREAYPTSGNKNWSIAGVTTLLRNPAYLGQARSGSVVNDKAHEPIVTRAEFDAAQLSRTQFAQREGSVAALAMLGGLARCAGCGHTLKIHGTPSKTGKRYPSYHCTGRYASGLCPARASIGAARLDDYVEQRVLDAITRENGVLAQALDANEEAEEAARRLTTAAHELELFVTDPELLTTLGRDTFLRAVQSRQAAVDTAREQLTTLETRNVIFSDLPSGELTDAWPQLTIPEKRQIMHGLLDRVTVTRDPARANTSLATTVAKRTQIVLKGGETL